MPSAPHLSALSSQTHQGVGARFLRRLGSAVRSAIGGITRSGRRRRPVAPPPGSNPQAAPALKSFDPPKSPSPAMRPRVRRSPPAARPAQPAQPGWIARSFGLARRQAASSRRARFPANGNAPFTPETCPGLTAEDCAILNTPVEDCDPDILRPLLAALAQHLAASLPPELGMTNPQAVFSTLWSRLGRDAGTDTAPAPQPDPAPDAPADAVPESPGAPPPPLPEPDLSQAPDSATAASESPPDTTILSKSGVHRGRSLGDCQQLLRYCRTMLSRCRNDGQQSPPPRRLCYAACAGPP